jgi:hypothetical protein
LNVEFCQEMLSPRVITTKISQLFFAIIGYLRKHLMVRENKCYFDMLIVNLNSQEPFTPPETSFSLIFHFASQLSLYALASLFSDGAAGVMSTGAGSGADSVGADSVGADSAGAASTGAAAFDDLAWISITFCTSS